MRKRTFTHRRWRLTSIRLSADDQKEWLKAARKEGMSRAYFLRTALRERAQRVLKEHGEERTVS